MLELYARVPEVVGTLRLPKGGTASDQDNHFRATLEKLPGVTKVEQLSAQTDERDGSHAVVFRLYTSVDAGMLLACTAQTVLQEHGELLDLHVAQPSLEDVFIYLTGRNLRP